MEAMGKVVRISETSEGCLSGSCKSVPCESGVPAGVVGAAMKESAWSRNEVKRVRQRRKTGQQARFLMTGLFINVSVSVNGFFVFLPGNHHKVFPTQLIRFFRQIASGIHRRGRPEVVMLPTLVRFIFATFFLISFAANAPKDREPITRDATIPVTSFIASTLH
jgi:hypothetical protein